MMPFEPDYKKIIQSFTTSIFKTPYQNDLQV